MDGSVLGQAACLSAWGPPGFKSSQAYLYKLSGSKHLSRWGRQAGGADVLLQCPEQLPVTKSVTCSVALSLAACGDIRG